MLVNLVFLLFTYGVLSIPIDDYGKETSYRIVRSPTFKKRPLAFLLGGSPTTVGGTPGHNGVNNYININNYGAHGSHPVQTTNHHPHQTIDYGHGGSASFAGSAAVAGGHGAQSQSQSASFSNGPYSVAFSQSQSQSRGGYNDFYDY